MRVNQQQRLVYFILGCIVFGKGTLVAHQALELSATDAKPNTLQLGCKIIDPLNHHPVFVCNSTILCSELCSELVANISSTLITAFRDMPIRCYELAKILCCQINGAVFNNTLFSPENSCNNRSATRLFENQCVPVRLGCSRSWTTNVLIGCTVVLALLFLASASLLVRSVYLLFCNREPNPDVAPAVALMGVNP